jgi:hypothetical protein
MHYFGSTIVFRSWRENNGGESNIKLYRNKKNGESKNGGMARMLSGPGFLVPPASG